jgi:hypothetical protein
MRSYRCPKRSGFDAKAQKLRIFVQELCSSRMPSRERSDGGLCGFSETSIGSSGLRSMAMGFALAHGEAVDSYWPCPDARSQSEKLAAANRVKNLLT